MFIEYPHICIGTCKPRKRVEIPSLARSKLLFRQFLSICVENYGSASHRYTCEGSGLAAKIQSNRFTGAKCTGEFTTNNPRFGISTTTCSQVYPDLTYNQSGKVLACHESFDATNSSVIFGVSLVLIVMVCLISF